MVIDRENSEGIYASSGATLRNGKRMIAVQESINTRAAIENVIDFSFRVVAHRRKRLTLCHTKNVLVQAGALYTEVLEALADRYREVQVDYVHLDAMCQHLPLAPERFDVVVTDNLLETSFSDLGATIQGWTYSGLQRQLECDR